jgi:hypothetical protein|tara:strand:+ start:2200 stop:2424 length:225 start_codon:yes stop_codon:yes gene_type:complete
VKADEFLSKHTIKVVMNNEEKKLYRSIRGVIPLDSFDERDQFIIDGLVRKSLVSKVTDNGYTMVKTNGSKLSNK